MNGYASFEIRDLDSNGTLELILTDHGPNHLDALYNYGPWRGKQAVFTWDGHHFIYSAVILDTPVFRFQAVQDADRQFLMGNYANALALYQDAIFSDKLLSWSDSARRYLVESLDAERHQLPIPTLPPFNRQEYEQLSAYARYRIVLYHLANGSAQDAATVLNTFTEKISVNSPGYPFVEMAIMLWDGYQKNSDLPTACQTVVQYVTDNMSILEALEGSVGLQSHQYLPEDVCPFR